MIAGQIVGDDQPYVEGSVRLPRLNVQAIVRFLVDTGAAATVLHPRDARKLGVDFGQLVHRVPSHGVGGWTKAFLEEAVLLFRDADSGERYEYSLRVGIAEPAGYNEGYPSLLGRDVLRCWLTAYDPPNGSVKFAVRRTIP